MIQQSAPGRGQPDRAKAYRARIISTLELHIHSREKTRYAVGGLSGWHGGCATLRARRTRADLLPVSRPKGTVFPSRGMGPLSARKEDPNKKISVSPSLEDNVTALAPPTRAPREVPDIFAPKHLED